jgi:hypothetical protein
MSFRTLGWFGPNCPLPLPPPPTTFSPPNEFKDTRMYNLQTKEIVNEFPLDIAMKIFWEAKTISVDASVTASYPISGGGTETGTLTGETSAEWSEISRPEFASRQPVQTAKELLCILKQPSSLFPNNHTNKATDFSVSPRLSIIIRAREFTDENVLYAPFLINVEGAIAPQPTQFGAQIFTTSVASINANQVGVANWTTPWGNTTSPLFFSASGGAGPHVSSFMNITVTAADPATRYA